MSSGKVKLEIAPVMLPLFAEKRGELRWRVAHGGRGSGKSFTIALMAALFGYAEPLRILCTREFQNSIKDSMHAEIKSAIEAYPFLSAHYEVGENYIRGANGTEFLFKGLRHNIGSIKSLAQIDLCIVEEAETVPHSSWQDLVPTIRAPKSEIWVVFNPKSRESWAAVNLVETTPPRSKVIQVNHSDNPWFPEVLDEQRKHDLEYMDRALYLHVWEGAYYEQSEAQVFSGRYRQGVVQPQPEWSGPYYGLDFGFSKDPTAAVKAWIFDRKLYIEKELYRHHLELDFTTEELLKIMPEAAGEIIYADNARPESISYLKRHGLRRMTPCKKGKGSIEDGVSFIRSFDEVVISGNCPNTLKEFDLYSYKVDRLSGDILSDIVDDNNHAIDALRYALERIMRKSNYDLGRL